MQVPSTFATFANASWFDTRFLTTGLTLTNVLTRAACSRRMGALAERRTDGAADGVLSTQGVKYHVDYLCGAKDAHGIEFDYVGIWVRPLFESARD